MAEQTKKNEYMGNRGVGPGAMRGMFENKPVKAKDGRKTLKRLFVFFEQERGLLYFIFFITLLIAAFGLLAPYFIGVTIDKIPITKGEGKDLYQIMIIVLFIIYLADTVMNILQSYLMAGLSQRVVLSIRSKLFGKLQSLSVSFFDKRPHGELMSRLANDVDNISSTIASSVTQFFVGVIMIVGALLMMLILSPLLTLASCITLPLMFLLTRSITKKTKKLFRAQQGQLGKLNGMIEENITGIQVVKAFHHEEASLKEFYQINQELAQTGRKAQIWSGLLMPFMNVINNLGFATVAFVGAYLAIEEVVTVGLIASFISYSRQFTRPLITLANIYNTLQTAVAGAERVFEILDEEEEKMDEKEALPMDRVRGDVRFEKVSFAYVGKEMILQDMSFEVKAGQKIALVGPTGAGKTTMVNLLSRFYDVTEGAIYIDGVDLLRYQRDALRQCFGIVLQDTYLFSGTIEENIRYGNPEASEEEMIAAAKVSNAHGFIRRLPLKYKTELIESGKNLSQGERQLIAITRAILSNHKILILDEATSNIDTRTEKHIQEAVRNLTKGRTSFVIAHRLSTIKDADRIFVIDQGRIAEEGTHEELMEQKGIYYEMNRI